MRELRIAPVMTGGTSLAVWMGGVTTELYRLLRCPTDSAADDGVDVYRELLELTNTTPVVDVITGTSAGGLNGALLAAAIACDVPMSEFAEVRQTWMEFGDIEGLLRSPHEANPPSLLKGDEYFVPKLQEVFKRWNRPTGQPRPPVDDSTVDLVTTLTTVTGVPNKRADDFGEPIAQQDHAQQLRFRGSHLAEDDWPARLAIAARTSASIPAVFEPSFIPISEADAKAAGRPSFARQAPAIRQSRWAVDGGVVVNLPLTEAIDRIFEREANGEVRRVMVYVCPTPSQPEQVVPDDPADQPDIRAALTTLVTAPRAEGVANDIDRIRASNEQVDRQERLRRHLGAIIQPPADGDDDSLADELGAYLAIRSRSSILGTLNAVRASIVGSLPADDEQLVAALTPARERLVREPGAPAPDHIVVPPDAEWHWGIAAVEQTMSMVLGLLGRAELLARANGAERPLLDHAHHELNETRTAILEVRTVDQQYWKARFAQLPAMDLTNAATAEAFLNWGTRSYEAWPDAGAAAAASPDPTVPTPTPRDRTQQFEKLARQHRRLATILIGIAPRIARLAKERAGEPNPLVASTARDVAAELRSLTPRSVRDASGRNGAFVVPDGGDERTWLVGTDEEIEAVRLRLLRAHVAQTLLLGEVVNREQKVELLQVSWNSPNALDPQRSPADKLAGPELGRLGAFVKPSWRANDWTWGRMDAAHRLVLLLLDPARLRVMGVEKVRPELEELVEKATGEPPTDAVSRELDALAGTEPLQAMPELAKVLAGRVQTAIACEELPKVAIAIEESEHLGSNEFRSRLFLAAVRGTEDGGRTIAPDEAPELVRQMRIGTEGVRTEFGFGLMNRIASRVSSIAVNALTGTKAGIPVVPRLVRPLKIPLQGVNSVVSTITGASPLAKALAAFIMAGAGAIVALRIAGIEVPGGVFAISFILLAGLFLSAMVRSGFYYLGTCFLLGAAVIGLTLAGPDLKGVVYSELVADSTSLPDGTVVTTESGAEIQVVTRGDGDVLTQLGVFPVDEDTEIRVVEGTVTAAGPMPTEEPPWKNAVFLNPWSVFRIFVGGLGLITVVGLVKQWWERYRWRRVLCRNGLDPPGPGELVWPWAKVGLVALATVGAIAGSDTFFTDLLTGNEPVDGEELSGLELWKDRVVDLADGLHRYELAVVLLLLIGAALLLTFATDVLASRAVKRTWAKVDLRASLGRRRLAALTDRDPDPAG